MKKACADVGINPVKEAQSTKRCNWAQENYKDISNSTCGLSGLSNHGWFNRLLAEMVTAVGRCLIWYIILMFDQNSFTIIYVDTEPLG